MTPAGKMKPFCKTFSSSAFVVSPHFCLIVQYFLLLHVLDVYTYLYTYAWPYAVDNSLSFVTAVPSQLKSQLASVVYIY